jgi:hypothetical protein
MSDEARRLVYPSENQQKYTREIDELRERRFNKYINDLKNKNPSLIMESDSEFRRAIHEFQSGLSEFAHKTDDLIERGGDGSMDDSSKLMIERLDRDSREREERYHKDAQEREQRYRQEMLEQDRRSRQEAKEREERLMASIESLKTDLKQDFKDVKDESRTTRNTVIGLAISVIIGIAAIVVAFILA